MSKELTEQWRNRAIKEGYYYILHKSNKHYICLILNQDYWLNKKETSDIIAPVPSYDQFVELTEKIEGLEQDNKCLKSGINTYESQLSCISEQLKEANEIIKFYSDARQLTEEEKQMTAEKYHLVYGLKANDYLERYDVK